MKTILGLVMLLVVGCSASPQTQPAQSTDYLGTTLTILQIIGMFGPQGPLSGGPSAPASAPQQQQQPTRCQDLGNGVVNCW